MGAQHTVIFTPSGLRTVVESNHTVLDAARSVGVDLDSVCGGRGVCGRCQFNLTEGEFPKWAVRVEHQHLSPPSEGEQTYRGGRALDGRRLGCQARIAGDIIVDVPPESQIHKQVVCKAVDVGELVLDPLISLRYLELDQREEEDSTPIDEQVRTELARQWAIDDVAIDPSLLAFLHDASATRSLTVALRGQRAVGVWAGLVERVFGVGIDIGSTTIAGYLCDLTTGEILRSGGRMNPQIRFGEDLMSRVSYAMMNDAGAEDLTSSVRAAIDQLIGDLISDAAEPDLDRSKLLDVVLVGNPIMHHLALGIDPTPLGQAPFTLATAGAVEMPSIAVGIDAPFAMAYFAPCIAGHVGADTAAAILNQRPARVDQRTLLVDVGTNAEIVLDNRGELFAASSPTGPAFEGAQISAGQRATPGAIERVRIDRVTLEPRFKVIGVEPWSDEAGFDAATAKTGVTGICGSGIIEVMSEMFLCGLIDAQGVIDPAGADRTGRVVPRERTFSYILITGAKIAGSQSAELAVTQNDVRAVQLAKAALRAGIDLLLSHAGIDAVDDIRLAGAFGAHIDPVHAMVLGLIPDGHPGAVRSVGNAAGAGAVRALLSASERLRMEDLAASVTKIETATEPRFQECFVDALALPHRWAPTPNLAQAIDLPVTSAETSGRPRRRKRRRPTW